MQIEPDTILAGRYRIEHCLGTGGMGAVWCAVDLRLQRRVAVKLAATSPSSGTSAGQARRRLRREAEALAALSEPRIARVYDLVQADDQDVCLVMELIDGESLAARLLREPRLPADEALEIAAQCAQALQAAHRIGIVHRDVKPSNIMLGRDGVKVVDFGIAAHIGPTPSDTTATMTHALVGTAAYLAPERALGEPTSGAADFYSLGVVLYQMLAGHLPFRAEESLAMLYAHTRNAPEPLPADVPAPAAALCMRMLSKRPEQRPTSTREINAAREALKDRRANSLSVPAAASAWLRAKPVGPTRQGRLTSRGMVRHETARSDMVPDSNEHAATRRRPGTLVAAVSSTAAVIAATSAWFMLDQPTSTAATTPPRATSSSAPGAAITSHSNSNSSGTQATTPVSLVRPQPSVTTAKASAKPASQVVAKKTPAHAAQAPAPANPGKPDKKVGKGPGGPGKGPGKGPKG